LLAAAQDQIDTLSVVGLTTKVTGKEIAEIHNALPGPEFFVTGDNLIYQSPASGDKIAGRLRIDPPRLVAIKFDTGKEQWARPIGETVYAGPYPGRPAKP
jgi:hypothetical protein